MQISSESKTLLELFPISGNIGYSIPEYQRNYSWKDEQIEQLFNDIYNEEIGYYVGNLLVTSHTGSEDIVDIIDGQQRLTTLSLFLLALWESLESLRNTTDSDEELTRSEKDLIAVLQMDIKRQLINGTIKSPRLQLLDPDRKYYTDLLKILEGGQPGRWGNRSFPKRYHYIKTLFDDSERFRTVQDFSDFYDKLKGINILKISVPGLSDAFNVFSSLNSKGLPLTLIDLLKVEFISAATSANRDKEETLDKWYELSSLFSENEGDTNNAVTTQFLLYNYDAFENKSISSITKGKALSQYRKIIKEHYNNNEDYLQTLITRGKIFARIIQLSDDEQTDQNIDSLLTALNQLEGSQAYPLVLFLMQQEDDLQIHDYLPDILNLLITFYVRRNITLVPKASNIRARMMSIIRRIASDTLTGKTIYELIANELHKMSSDDEALANAITQDGVYDKNKKTTRFILIDLERKLEAKERGNNGTVYFNKANPDTLDEEINGKPRWSIEHILPQGPLKDDWKDMIAPENREEADLIQEKYVHMIGNLTLSPFNPDLGQKPYVDSKNPFNGQMTYKKAKRDFRENGNFVGVRLGIQLNSSIDLSANSWTGQSIEARNIWFKNLILDYYSFPENLPSAALATDK